MKVKVLAGVALALLRTAVVGAQTKAVQPSSEAVRFFENSVRPLMADHCLGCHGAAASGGLKLDSRESILKGGGRGAAIVPGDPANSLLIKAINQTDVGLKMPPGKKLSEQQIADLTQWVKIGAPWPRAVKREDQNTRDRHWAFQPVKRPAVPTFKKNKAWASTPIDAFILAKLQEKGLTPSRTAPRNELIRRAYYDLIGLPPSPKEVDDFLKDGSTNAWENLVDRLLASPHYGEKWGRHWLDIVRYAETNSYEGDSAKPSVWRYRDYVIRSLNEDKPYNRFILEQIAGDELVATGHASNESGEKRLVSPFTDSPIDPIDCIIATGFYRLGIWDGGASDPLQARYDELDDIVATTSQVFLGLTIDCARCHDHKLDPIPQRDYYRLLAFFQGMRRYGAGGDESIEEASLRAIAPDEERILYEAEKAKYKNALRPVETRLAEIDKLVFLDLSTEDQAAFQDEKNRIRLVGARVPRLFSEETYKEYIALTEQRNNIRAHPPRAIAMALCVTEEGASAQPTFVLVRGSPHAQGEQVEPGFPTILNPPQPSIQPVPDGRSSGRRLALASWLASRDNPVTARVMMNRIWQHHFGRGLVRSPNNFGLQGDKPSHPELLDWLASEFMQQGWSLKTMHKQIMMSNAYKMSSQADLAGLEADPSNDLLSRFNMGRLTAEEIRDSILAVTGSLNLKMFGPSIYPEIPAEVLAGQSRPGHGWETSTIEEQDRRSIYVHVKRSLLLPVLDVFDLADTDRTTAVRFSSTQPTQALLTLNSTFINKQAERFASRLRKEAGDDVRAQVQLALLLATQRTGTPSEVERGVKLIETLRTVDGASAEVSLKYFCLMVLNLNEFIYLD